MTITIIIQKYLIISNIVVF